jgi:hypothetical protein
MMKGVLPTLLRQHIAAAIQKAKTMSAIPHTGLQGRFRELLVGDVLAPLLPSTCMICRGTVIDSEGARFETRSPLGKYKVEDDILIVDRETIPPLLLAEAEGVVPVESVLARFEIKSTLTATELRDAIDGAMLFNSLKNGLPAQDLLGSAALRCVFAFDTDLTMGGKSEFERFKEQVEEVGGNLDVPPVVALCVVGRGFWCHLNDGQVGGWRYCPATGDHNEVLSMLGVVMNSLPALRAKRTSARLGAHVVDPNDFVPC